MHWGMVMGIGRLQKNWVEVILLSFKETFLFSFYPYAQGAIQSAYSKLCLSPVSSQSSGTGSNVLASPPKSDTHSTVCVE